MDAFTLTVQESCDSWSSPPFAARRADASPPAAGPNAGPSAHLKPTGDASEPTPNAELRRRLRLPPDPSTPADSADRTLTAENLLTDLDDEDDRAVPVARVRIVGAPQSALPAASAAANASPASAPPAKQTRVAVLDSLDILPHFLLAAVYVIVHSMLFLVQVVLLCWCCSVLAPMHMCRLLRA